MNKLLIIGAGGHGKVVADTAQASGKWSSIAFLDDQHILKKNYPFPVLGDIEHAFKCVKDYNYIAVAIGDNQRRVNLLKKFKDFGFKLPAIIHPSAVISKYSIIDEGSVIFANCVINANAVISFGCIINTACTVDHDCILGAGVHLSPGVNLAGGVRIGDFCWIGIGATIIQQITIDQESIVGAGAVIIENVPSTSTVVGVPGRVIKRFNNEV
ncbi:acetyltransferase [Paenibacillus filicis]|uniref:Acetyltransferase n=1 Tax=Paenibacillus filicis TaxID=669464 RepID=A0ABU9DFR6_9BACL